MGRSKKSNSYKRQSLDKGTLVVYLRGGLGNQLFQLSAARALSAVTARKALFSTMLLPRAHDQLRGVSRWPLEIRSLIRDDEKIDERWHQPLGATSLRSKLFTTLSYLTARSDVLARLSGVAVDFSSLSSNAARGKLRLLSLKLDGEAGRLAAPEIGVSLRSEKSGSFKFKSLLEEVEQLDPIIIHLRRGDYLNHLNVYGRADQSYWRDAVSRFFRPRPVWVFSDDASGEAVRSELGFEPTRFVGPEEELIPLELLRLMTTSSAFVGSNSTFSWWCAALGPGHRISVLPDLISAKSSIRDLGEPAPGVTWLQR